MVYRLAPTLTVLYSKLLFPACFSSQEVSVHSESVCFPSPPYVTNGTFLCLLGALTLVV